MKVAFRVDASREIGTGHFMRCLTLADALKIGGTELCFVCRYLPKSSQNILKERNYELLMLDSNKANGTHTEDLAHAHWLGTSQDIDAQDTLQALSGQTWDWLIVDHYALDARWETVLRQAARQIMVIDDLADRQHDCDILLDQNFYADMNTRYDSKVPTHCQLLLGPRHALLRDEFRQLHVQIKPRSGSVKRVVVFFGGVDADNLTGHAIMALSEMDIPGLHVDVIIGVQHPCCEQIKAVCAQHGFFCYVQTVRVAELMAAADLAIGAGGGATWERCCLGLPALAFAVADNQKLQVADAARAGLLYSPSCGPDWTATIKKHVMALFDNIHLRWFISNRAIETVDGRGVLRVLSWLDRGGIDMRVVTADDSQRIFEWRNNPAIRAVSRNKELIPWENHQKWFAAVMGSRDRILLIGQKGEEPVGVVRFDVHGNVAEISIYLVPGGNPGLGRELLLKGEQWIKKSCPDVKLIRSYVLGGNESSHRLFSRADYQVEVIQYLKSH